MKELIKQLASEQPALKKARKTGTIPELPRNSWGDINYSEIPTAFRIKLKESFSAVDRVRYRKVKITAALNLYHEMRGSDYRHGYIDSYEYRRECEKLREQFADQLNPCECMDNDQN